MALAPLSASFQSLPPVPTIKLGPSGADFQVGGLVHTLGPCGSLWQRLLWGREFLLLPPQPSRVFSIRGLRLYCPVLEPWVARSALLPRHSSRSIYARQCGVVGSASWRTACRFHNPPPCRLHQSLPCQESSPPRLPVSAPPTGLDECFFFISLVVRLP